MRPPLLLPAGSRARGVVCRFEPPQAAWGVHNLFTTCGRRAMCTHRRFPEVSARGVSLVEVPLSRAGTAQWRGAPLSTFPRSVFQKCLSPVQARRTERCSASRRPRAASAIGRRAQVRGISIRKEIWRLEARATQGQSSSSNRSDSDTIFFYLEVARAIQGAILF